MTKYKIIKEQSPFDSEMILTSAYTNSGHYIGNVQQAEFYYNKGIEPELASPTHKVCSIGFCAKEEKWYGWSHRAIFSFGIGSTVKRGDCACVPRDKNEFADYIRDFWVDENYVVDGSVSIKHIHEGDRRGVKLRYLYNCSLPNEELHGTWNSTFYEYPEKWGRGEWEAKTLDDAKQMAIDFAESVS